MPSNTPDPNKKILVTGAAGFIGFHLSKRLLDAGIAVAGYDNINDYYDVNLKYARLGILDKYEKFRFYKDDLSDKEAVRRAFADFSPDIVVNLAAQAGVRYSITNPDAYIRSNVVGFFNILEAVRHSEAISGKQVGHLLYASSSSVYGNRDTVPFSTDDDVSKPISLYAATKKTNELMAYAYSHLYRIPTTGLRFFTVYGPYGRPDMACFLFADLIRQGKPIRVFNNGDMKRDFTYVDDIVEGIVGMLDRTPKGDADGENPAVVYNIGNSHPEDLLYFIETLEKSLMAEGVIDAPAKKEFLPMQAGDVYQTYADITPLTRDFGFAPGITIEDGLRRFAKWYREFYLG